MATATFPTSNAAQRPVASGDYSNSTLPAQSAVSWTAVAAGAAAAAALSLILLLLGTGLGLSSVSPWAQQGISAEAFGMSTILWLSFTQLAASGLGGYIAGRLRIRWTAVHTDEVYFRDTAHGFLAWAVSTLVTAAFLSSVIASIASSGVQAGAAIAGGAATAATAATTATAATNMGTAPSAASRGGRSEDTGYFIDALFRKDPANAAAAAMPGAMTAAAPSSNMDAGGNTNANMESTRIFMQSIASGPLPAEDVHYLGQLVAQRTGLSQADAEKRVTDVYNRMQTKMHDAQVAARDAADKARKASTYAALWLFISLLLGAFVSSFCATFGGRQRDAF